MPRTRRYLRSPRTTAAGGRIPPCEPYPATVDECIEDRTYKPAAVAAIRDFRRSKPWRGDWQERAEKLMVLHQDLCAAYGLTTRLEFERGDDAQPSGSSCYMPQTNTIRLRGRLSVVTYLHEFAHALGYGEQGACRWSINLFRRFVPRSYARLQHEGHCLVRPEE
jgi:hypothetical protein